VVYLGIFGQILVRKNRALSRTVYRGRRTPRLAEDKLSYPVGRIIILSEDSLDIG